MQKIHNEFTLQGEIIRVQSQIQIEKHELKQMWDETREELSPMHLIKDGVKDAFESPNFKSGLIKGVLSLATGFVTRNLILGGSPGIVRKVVGTLAQTGATSLAFKGGDTLKEKAAPILSTLLKKLKIKE